VISVTLPKNVRIHPLRFGRFLPKNFLGSNWLLGSWVSPLNVNYNNRLVKGDNSTLRGRVKTTLKQNNPNDLIKTALHSKWFSWRVLDSTQVLKHTPKHKDTFKILMFKIDIRMFTGESKYRRFLTLCSVVEYFVALFKPRDNLETLLVVFNSNLKEPQAPFIKFSSKYKSYYFTHRGSGMLGALTALNKVYKLQRRGLN
jgi:hypothetical protein